MVDFPPVQNVAIFRHLVNSVQSQSAKKKSNFLFAINVPRDNAYISYMNASINKSSPSGKSTNSPSGGSRTFTA